MADVEALSFVVTLICLPIAYPLAHVLWPACRRAGRRASCFWFPSRISPRILIRSYAWVVLLANNGVVNKLLLASGLVDGPT